MIDIGRAFLLPQIAIECPKSRTNKPKERMLTCYTGGDDLVEKPRKPQKPRKEKKPKPNRDPRPKPGRTNPKQPPSSRQGAFV
jgi:hypothetical protein